MRGDEMDEEFDPDDVERVRWIVQNPPSTNLEKLLVALYRHYWTEYQTLKFAEPALVLDTLKKELKTDPNALPTDAIDITRWLAECAVNSEQAYKVAIFCPCCGQEEKIDFKPSARTITITCQDYQQSYRIKLASVTAMQYRDEQDDDPLLRIKLIDSAGMPISIRLTTWAEVKQVENRIVQNNLIALLYANGRLARIEVEPVMLNNQRSPYYQDIVLVQPSQVIKEFQEQATIPNDTRTGNVGSGGFGAFMIAAVILAAIFLGIFIFTREGTNSSTTEATSIKSVAIPTGQPRIVMRDATAMVKSIKPERVYKSVPAGTEVTIMGLSGDRQWVQLAIDNQSTWIPIDVLDPSSMPTNLTARSFTAGLDGLEYDVDGNGAVNCKDFKAPDAAMQAYLKGHHTLDTNRDGIACGRGDAS
jgi:hypothetical protein